MSTARTPTGRREPRGGADALVLERAFPDAAETVWAAITEPARLERWIGTWSGDPATGTVDFAMTAEGEDVPAEPVEVSVCEAPSRLAVSLGEGWRLELTLAAAAPGTVLTFAHLVDDPAAMADVGPGWEYYLDRLTVALAGGEVADIRFTDYHPAQCDYYRELFES
ncbi:SRPBCC domain-containing protein [Herbiconiux sp. VKM Ac-2851]|uniref:SRPBCC domain-containing protein n=1 Tax=Herbiconiux sp. VKM Ac-2851 TaxID=2739025 RepID=UPI0015647FDC|nr:SRPBCC domain-containing protein [Herbiconiux sp. VKM Ac-2851]NQX33556.1 SRPBCC domain-containing protein [Herbiconiux sp. VKM Ac-2851]